MLQYLKLYSLSQPCFSPACKIFPIVKKNAKLLLLRFSRSQHNIKLDRKAEPPNKDKIILYQYDNDKYFTKIKFITLSNFVLWSLVGYNVYCTMSIEPKIMDAASKQKWDEFAGKREFAKKLLIGSSILGLFFVLALGFYFMRSVRQIELIKSTKIVKFQTYSFFPSVREFTVPLKNVSGVVSRHSAKTYIPIKVKNTSFYFLLDVKGHFPDTFLFDNSVSVKRDFEKD